MDYLRYLIWLAVSLCALAAPLPNDAPLYIKVLKQEIDSYWPDLDPRTWPAGLIEQESLWKLKATLKTSRELGCGFGQFTKAYNADGSVRFDALEETRRLDPSLAGWSWRECYNAQYQLRAVILKLRVNNRQCVPLMADNRNTKACAAAMYNGGGGSIIKRIRACQLDPKCKPDAWFGNLEFKAPQSAKKSAGYGESFAETNSRYPARVEARMPKYKDAMQ